MSLVARWNFLKHAADEAVAIGWERSDLQTHLEFWATRMDALVRAARVLGFIYMLPEYDHEWRASL